MMPFKNLIAMFLRPKGKTAFLHGLGKESAILDVGCGNDSPFFVISILPHSFYTGLDVEDCKPTQSRFADRYIVAAPENFASEIAKFKDMFDAILSSHNIEHCDDRVGAFTAMLGAVKPGGQIYLSFPCEQSVGFPKRAGCLNYFDDSTHKNAPPIFGDFIRLLESSNFQIEFSARNYRPFFLWLVGLIVEPYSAHRKKVCIGTWEYYGFESIIVAKKSSVFPV